MPTGRHGLAFRSIRTLFGAGTSCGLSDAQLLDRFIARDDDDRDAAAEAAFEALVMRHGPLVLDVCRNVLGHSHDAEDAFQATFLILATKAASVRRRTSVASWLYGVALRTASRLRLDAARRRLKERRAAETRPEEVELVERQRDFRALHEEVGRLPQKYRDPIILCYLEGMTQEMAAAQLRCPVGTVGVRLMRAKARLKESLGRRGESIAPGVCFAPISGGLIRSTVESAIRFTEAGPVSLAVAQLTREVSKAMLMMKLKGAAAVLLVAGTIASGAGFLTHFAAADDPQAIEKTRNPKSETPKSDLEELRGTWVSQAENIPAVAEKWVIDGDTIRTFPRLTEQQARMLASAPDEKTYLINLDPNKSPKTIDFTMPGLETFAGIYELDVDSLKICYSFGKRPTNFVHDPKKDMNFLTFGRTRRTPEEVVPRFATDPGCYWVTYPSRPGWSYGNQSFAMMTVYESDVLTIHLACPAKNPDEGRMYCPVAFDAERTRYYPRLDRGVGIGMIPGKTGTSLFQYRLDKETLKGKSVEFVGVELIPPENITGGKLEEKPNSKP